MFNLIALFATVTDSAINVSESGIGFVESIRTWAENSSFLNAFSGVLNSALVLSAIVFFNRYVAPKLAQMKFFNSELDKVYDKLELLDQHIEKNTGLELNLINQLNGIKEILDIAFTNSNLSQVSKQLIRNIVMSINTGNTEDLKEQFNELTEEGKEVTKQLIQEANVVSENLRKTALEQLQASLSTEEE